MVKLVLKTSGLAALPVLALMAQVPSSGAAQQPSTIPEVPGGSSFPHQIPVVDGKRVALVIGNAAYTGKGWRPLDNASNDAQQISASLQAPALGSSAFDVTTVINGSREEILTAVDAFRRKARSADVALIYFSGHGFQYGNTHYVVPIGAPDGAIAADQLDGGFVTMDELLTSAKAARGIRMLFLDACRDGGAVITGGGGEITKGSETTVPFGEISAPQFAIFYATGKGNKAYAFAREGDAISPFAAAVSRGMSSEGLELNQLFQHVTYDVYRSTLHKRPPQQPHQEGSSYARFYFRPPVTVSQMQGAEKSVGGPAKEQPVAPKRLEISYEDLSTVDERLLAARVLTSHSPRELLTMAEGGDPLATYLIGFMYSKGMGFELNRTEARKWLEKAAATGHPAGQLELGAFLLDPEFSSAAGDRERGWELVELASQKDYAKANSYLAYGLLTGSYRKVDNARAKALLQKASDAGHPYAIFALGYHFGEKQASMNKLRQLAKGGNLDGDHWLCIFAFNDKDHATAAETCSRAAKANFPNAKARLALLFENGKGVPAASDRATYWAKQALLTPDLEAGYRPRMKELASR